MKEQILPTIKKYIGIACESPYSRYKSWDNCRLAFSTTQHHAYHKLELAFFLASWGMYRGSSGLLQRNHLVHQGAVDLLYATPSLKCTETREVTEADIDEIMDLKKRLCEYYQSIPDTDGRKISPTDTLISKIMLGTHSCIPAYDQFFINGLQTQNEYKKHASFNRESLVKLFAFAKRYEGEIANCQHYVKQKINAHYPVMKIVDMFFWQTGCDKLLALAEARKKEANILY